MKKEGFHPDSYSYNGVLLALSRAGDFEQTIKTLKEMARYGVQPDVLSFLCAIDAARRSRRAHLAFSLFHTMKKAKIKPSRQIFTSLIRCCAHIDKKAPGTHDTTQSFLAVPWKTAMLLLDEMKELGVTPDVHTYASLLSVLATFSKSKEAQVIFQEMIHNGIAPNEYCLFNMMQVYAKIDDWERCVEVFYHVTGLGATADESCYKLVLNACLKLSNTEVQAKTAFDVLQFFQRDNSSSMSNLKTGDGQNLRKTELYNLGLKCCEQTGNIKAAKEILQMMKRTGVEQDIISLNRAIGACQASGAHKQALDLLKEVQESSDSLLRPNVFTYTAVMRVYIKAGLYSEVKKLLLLSQAAAKDTADYPLTITSKAETKGMLHIAAIQAFHSAGMYEYAETVFKDASDLELFGNEILASIENSYSQDSPAVVIDLHGYVLPVAHMAIRRAMSEVLGVAQHCQQSVKPIEIITGSGKHSINNKPVLRPEIQNMLVEEFFPPIYTSTKPGNSGRIIITTDSILEWLSHTAEAKNNIMMGLKVVLEQQIEKKKGDGCSH
uniref:Smr domain-containing protein n=1 Tax=Heterosigma akashiwo TaxID=2829 RepID=A0A7S3XTI1_HETAK